MTTPVMAIDISCKKSLFITAGADDKIIQGNYKVDEIPADLASEISLEGTIKIVKLPKPGSQKN